MLTLIYNSDRYGTDTEVTTKAFADVQAADAYVQAQAAGLRSVDIDAVFKLKTPEDWWVDQHGEVVYSVSGTD